MSDVQQLNISYLGKYANIAIGKNATCRNMHSKSESKCIPGLTPFKMVVLKTGSLVSFGARSESKGVKQVEIVNVVTSWKCCDCSALCFNMYTIETCYQVHTYFHILHTGWFLFFLNKTNNCHQHKTFTSDINISQNSRWIVIIWKQYLLSENWSTENWTLKVLEIFNPQYY